MKFLLTLTCTLGLSALAGCAADDDDMYLTGTEEHAIRTENGQFVCPTPRKALVCHIPPGNPDNAHTICVSSHAVETHQSHHSDTIGACIDGGGDPPPPPPQDDPETPPPVL